MRAALRFLFCLCAWLTLSPLADAASVCLPPAPTPKTCHTATCCAPDGTCAMPGMQGKPLADPCARCEAAPIPLAVTATTPDAPPPLLVSRDEVINLERLTLGVQASADVEFHPPPPTLLSLGTMLTC